MDAYNVSRIVGVGIDLVSISRIEGCLKKWGDRFYRKVFTAEEIEVCRRKTVPSRSLAARFAAKEAVMKALGTGWGSGIRWIDLSITEGERGMPYIKTPCTDSHAALLLKGKKIHLSLTHTDEIAAAFVVIEEWEDNE